MGYAQVLIPSVRHLKYDDRSLWSEMIFLATALAFASSRLERVSPEFTMDIYHIWFRGVLDSLAYVRVTWIRFKEV